MPGRRLTSRSGVRAACVTAAVAVFLAACGSSGFHYVKSSEDRAYFKVPESWKLYDNDTLLDARAADLNEDEVEQLRDTQWITVFDAHPTPALAHVANRAPKFPVGRAIVQDLSPENADGVSLMSLRNLFYDVDTALENETGDVLRYDSVERDGGFHGSHVVARLSTKRGDIVVNQLVLLDQATTKVYGIAVSCSTECYDRNQSKIEQIIDSWTVEAS